MFSPSPGPKEMVRPVRFLRYATQFDLINFASSTPQSHCVHRKCLNELRVANYFAVVQLLKCCRGQLASCPS
jgi:hypothetical protein